jgi:hypothetical protein
MMGEFKYKVADNIESRSNSLNGLIACLHCRQGAVRASKRCHISCSFGPHLPTEVGSGAATCPAASDLTSLLR